MAANRNIYVLSDNKALCLKAMIEKEANHNKAPDKIARVHLSCDGGFGSARHSSERLHFVDKSLLHLVL
jgi:hypothetical protein